jgi:myo-inositol-1(or 4)-monophosphatase
MKELKVCFEAAKAAAALIDKYYGKKFSVRHKGEINLVTEVDEKCQRLIVKTIHEYFKKDAILAEEGDLSTTADSPRRWIVDPIDGTTNFAHGYPRFCVSIAFEQERVVQCGVIHDPSMKEVFHAVRGKGAFVNKKRLKVSSITSLKQALLVTGFPYDLDDPKTNNVPLFLHMLRKAQAIRRDGSACLNLAYIAAGRFDGFWELGVNPWDIAVGLLLIEEAGGKTSHFSGRPAKVTDNLIVAGNPEIYRELLHEVQAVWGKEALPRTGS